MIQCRLTDLQQRCQERGYTLEQVRPCIVSEGGDSITVDETHDSYPRPRSGPGTHLKALLKDLLSIESSPTCSCNAMARRMDSLGPDWCEGEGMASILDVMRAEHAKRWADGRTILPWTDLGARQLVLLACRRARANG
jgi:hypothetical protein